MVKSAELVFYTGYNLMIVPVESLHSLQRAILAKEKNMMQSNIGEFAKFPMSARQSIVN